MSDILNISQCNLAQTIGETNRFLFHVILVHFSTCIIEGKKTFFGEELFRTLLITAMAITMYHVFFRKIIEPKVEKMKMICYNDKERVSKKKEISKHTKTEDESRIKSSAESEEFITIKSRSTTGKRTDREKRKKTKNRNKCNKEPKYGNTPGNYSKRK